MASKAKTQTDPSSTEPNPDTHDVFIHGQPIADVLSFDVAKGEVWVHDGVDKTKAKELKTGTVTLVPKSQASAGRTSASLQSTSGE